MDPFRLVILSDATEPGGAEMVMAHLLAGLPEEIDVQLVGVDEAVMDAMTIGRSSTGRHLIAPIEDRRDLRNMWRLRQLLAGLDADVIQFNLSMMSSLQWQMLVASTVRGPKMIAVENSPMARESSLSNRLKRVTSRRLDAHVAVGEATARIIESLGDLPPGSVGTIYHGVADDGPTTTPFDRLPPPDPATPLRVGTIARHDPVKGVDVLIDAVALVDDVVAVLIGDGAERERLIAQRARLGLDERVEFRATTFGGDARAQLDTFDVFVLPSRLEGFPVTIMEAMLAGLPVIATDVGSVRESVSDGETGLVVTPGDAQALADAIAVLRDDPTRRDEMGRRGREVAVQRFTVEATVERYLDLYRQVLG